MNMDGRYYVEGMDIYKAPLQMPRSEGGSTITIGFRVCRVSDCVKPEDVARALNIAEFGW